MLGLGAARRCPVVWYLYLVPVQSIGLARLTVNSPQRRVDVALPDGVPVAEVLPELLRHAGEGLADVGERHGGWLLRRADGVALAPSAALAAQGVRDGAVLYLVPARADWPELEYDDVVEAVAAAARRQGTGWSGAATRTAGLVAAGLTLAIGLLAAVASGDDGRLAALVTLVVGSLLMIGGVIASRAYGDATTGAVLAAYALPHAFVGGALTVAPEGPPGDLGPAGYASCLLVGSVTLLLVSLLAAVGVGHLLRLFVCGVTAGLLGVAGALLAYPAAPAPAAAIVLVAVVCGVAAVPLLAIRLGRLPMPVLALPAETDRGGRPREPQPDRARVVAAVARTDEMLTGMLLGCAVVGAVALGIVGTGGGACGDVLVGVASVAMLLRARLFVTVRQRLPLICCGLAGIGLSAAGAVAAGGGAQRLVVAAGLGAGGLVVAAASARFSSRTPSPYLGRLADVLDVLCVVSVVPLGCAVLGLFGLVRAAVG